VFQTPAPDVHVSVRDFIDVGVDASIVVTRRFAFVADSPDPRPIEYVRREDFGTFVHPEGSVLPAATLRMFGPGLPGLDTAFRWELKAQPSTTSSVFVDIRARIKRATSDSPLAYGVTFDSPHTVSYTMRLRPALPDLTAPGRMSSSLEPDGLAAEIERLEGGDCCTSEPIEVSTNRTGPIRIDFEHHEELGSTLLMEFYADELAS
jgi:hypothetical protein